MLTFKKNEILDEWARQYPNRAFIYEGINFLVIIGAVITSIWSIVLVTQHRGFAGCIGGVFAASMVYRFGPAPLFVVASSVIAFVYHKTGIWLPITSYIFALISLLITVALQRVASYAEASDFLEK